jgi:hypothetical protein
MVVRIRLNRYNARGSELRNTALAVAALLTPSALIAFTISFWSIAADFRWTGNFFVSNGPFSHWQVWIVTAALLALLARLLQHFAEAEHDSSE